MRQKSTYVFFSILTFLGLVGLGIFKPNDTLHFFECWPLWWEPVLAGMVCGFFASVLGLYIIWSRVVFLSLAITQGAGLGIFTYFLIASFFGVGFAQVHGQVFGPLGSGFLVALLTTWIFLATQKDQKINQQTWVALLYVIASGLVMMVGDRIAYKKHMIDHLIFGSAVAVSFHELLFVGVLAFSLLFVFYFWRRPFLLLVSDIPFMQTLGFRPKYWQLFFYFLLTLGITLLLKTIGALPSIALMVIPGFLALKNRLSLKQAFPFAMLIGALIPFVGYYFSFLYSFPTGASIIFVGGIYLVLNLLKNAFTRACSHFKF